MSSSIMKALSLLATESWDTERPEERDHWRALVGVAREEFDELRTQAFAYRRICELLGYTDGAHGRSGMHCAAAETVCNALRDMLNELSRYRDDDAQRRNETGL